MTKAGAQPGDIDPGPEDWKEDAGRLIEMALREDLDVAGDVTSELTIPEDATSRARLVTRESGIVCGLPVAAVVLETVARSMGKTGAARFEPRCADGDSIAPGDLLADLSGSSRVLLAAERTLLNFLQRLSGIATRTRQFVELLEGSGVRIIDTRKTTPGWRRLEKYAVRSGGGWNHRMGLHDMVLVKDNHIAAAGGIEMAVLATRPARERGLRVEIEVARLEDLDPALAGHPDGILLDNMSPDTIRKAVAVIRGVDPSPWIEVSGGITLENVREYAVPGVDFISSGSLTHSVRSLDIALDFVEERR